jgi:hypothetical protein
VAAGVSVLAASCFAQAVSISAAMMALRASLVFIVDTPRSSGEKTVETCFARGLFESHNAAWDSIDRFGVLKQPA